MLKNITVLYCLTLICGCAATDENLKYNIYEADPLITAKNPEPIGITGIIPKKNEAGNSEQKKNTQMAMCALGEITGEAGGGLEKTDTPLEAATSSPSEDKVLVKGVIIDHADHEKPYASILTGKRICKTTISARVKNSNN